MTYRKTGKYQKRNQSEQKVASSQQNDPRETVDGKVEFSVHFEYEYGDSKEISVEQSQNRVKKNQCNPNYSRRLFQSLYCIYD